MTTKLAIVTCTLDPVRAAECMESWWARAIGSVDTYVVQQAVTEASGWMTYPVDDNQGGLRALNVVEILGVVPAFALGVQKALEDGAQIIACLHDDLLIEQDGWDEEVVRLFKACPRAGLVGFGGAKGLGSDDLYKSPYNPMQLARQGFRSNMRDAEAHGIRSENAEPVACLDGFSQIGLAKFWKGYHHDWGTLAWKGRATLDTHPKNLFAQMADAGLTHHWYDGHLGALAKRLNYMVWYVPIRCHHFGGRTAVADTRYTEWALTQDPKGDGGFWEKSHRIGYDTLRDVLPIRT